MRWLPAGLAAHAIQDASDGRPGVAFARLGALAAVIVVFGWLWVSSLGRALVTADTTTQAGRVRGGTLPLAGSGCAAPLPPGTGSTSAASRRP